MIFARGFLSYAAAAATSLALAAEAPDKPPAPGGDVFAVVGATVITSQEYDSAFNEAKRQKFYHRKPPESQVSALQREVGDRLINRALLLAEAGRRGLKPDREKINKTIAGYDARYGNSEQWKQNRQQLLPGLVQQLERQDLLERLEKTVRGGPPPTDRQVQAYYDAHREQFTEPEKVRLSVILLKVDPSSAQIVWDKAREEAGQIVKRLKGGADFAGLARLHSGDTSSQKGGDVGYLHRGMLQDAMQKVIDGLKSGAISEPVTVLEGVAIVRLEDRQPAEPRPFADVKARAAGLWERERAEEQWSRFIARLRKATTIHVDESRYPSLKTGGKTSPASRLPSGVNDHAFEEQGA